MAKRNEINDEYARYLFHRGENFTAYKFLGAHRLKNGETVFRVWAPNAERVELVSDTLGWENGKEMDRLSPEGVWQTFLTADQSPEWMRYKYKIVSSNGTHLKSDPYGFHFENEKNHCTKLYTKKAYRFTDRKYMEKRKELIGKEHFYPNPLNIYEVHLTSFMTKNGQPGALDTYLNYRELARILADYAHDFGYTHIELLPITEYPYDGSWGYQVGGYFAPTARCGTPDDFKYFVNYLHNRGIGVILDFVPAHFPKDDFGLKNFDGGPLYEYGNERMEQPSWGTRMFDVARNEVQSFLISSALFWIRECHIDGLRIDAVAAMLYLDFDRKPGTWKPNIYGGNINLESVVFFKRFNSAIKSEFPDVLTIAEESTAYPKVTESVENGGLGFSFKWNMGWANDMFSYFSTDPYFRKDKHNELTFTFTYATAEKYVLPVSHDEVVHLKKSLIEKQFGSYEQKFAGIRLFLLMQMTYPGKKLLFMGSEFGQFHEWDFSKQLDWFLLDYPSHRALAEYSKSLNHFYLSHPALYEDDFSWNGISWIEDHADMNLLAYTRRAFDGRELYVVLNFSGCDHRYRLPVPSDNKKYKVVFSSCGTIEEIKSSYIFCKKTVIDVDLPSLSGVIVECIDN